jgi:hypothetical protein
VQCFSLARGHVLIQAASSRKETSIFRVTKKSLKINDLIVEIVPN